MRNESQALSVSRGEVSGIPMKAVNNTLQTLRRELKFVDSGGYRTPIAWRSPLVFEDSPTCPKKRGSPCPDTDCVLMGLVPRECRGEVVPCRHIPLNEVGETIDSLYRTGTNEEIEETLRSWLVKTIERLERPAPLKSVPWHEKAA